MIDKTFFKNLSASKTKYNVLHVSHAPENRWKNDGYMQAVRALNFGLNTLKKGMSTVIRPYTYNNDMQKISGKTAFVFDVKKPISNKTININAYYTESVLDKGCDNIYLQKEGDSQYFAFNTYQSADTKSNLMCKSESYMGGPITEAALTYNLAAQKLASIINNENSDSKTILHGHDHLTALATIIAGNNGIPTVFTVHNPAYTTGITTEILKGLSVCIPEWASKNNTVDLLGLAMERSDVVTTVSPNYAKEIGNLYFGFSMGGKTDHAEEGSYGRILYRRSRPIIGILNGLLPEFLSCGAMKFPDPKECVNVLFANRLSPQKGYDLFTENAKSTIPLINMLNGKIHFSIVADENNDNKIEEDLCQIRQSVGTEFLTIQKYDDEALFRELGKSHVALMPSGFEPGGIFLMTAQANGVLGMGTPVGGLIDIIGNGDARRSDFGLFFSENTNSNSFWTQLTSTIKKLRDGDNEINTIKLRALRHAQSYYQPTRVATDYIEKVYEPLLSSKNS
jgi:glycogen synthase